MSNGITATGFFLNNTGLINNGENELQILTNQLNSGTKSTTLAGYGTAAPTVLNLNSTINETQAYVNNSTQVGTYLSAYDSSLTELQSDATQLSNSIGSLGANDPISSQNLADLVKGLQVDVTATLNSQVGG